MEGRRGRTFATRYFKSLIAPTGKPIVETPSRRAKWSTVSAAACIFVLAFASPGVRAADAAADRPAIASAAEALGGLERVRAVRNITLIGYGMWAYQFGGGNVTASPVAVQRYLAANDLRRVYDLEHDRFAQIERRNMLFTFARAAPTQWQPFNLVLDGDVAFDVNPDGKAHRVQRWDASAWYVDGVHMRRMWMLNNPVALVRAALDPSSRLSAPRSETGIQGAQQVFDVTLQQGDSFTMALSGRTHLPAWIRWNNPHNTFGEFTFTTYFEGYEPYQGLMLPTSYNTKSDWRNISELQISVDGYQIDGPTPDLAASAAVRAMPDTPQASPVTATRIADHIWYLSGGPVTDNRAAPQGTTVYEFADHLVIFELNSKLMAKAIIEKAKTLVPGKVPTMLITSHAHTDHIDGIRVAVAEGLTVISRRENELIIHDMIAHPAPDYPDELSMHPMPLKFIPVDEHLRLSDSMMTVDVYWARTNSHMADGLFAYAPAQKIMSDADIAFAAIDYQPWADNYLDDLEYYKLDVREVLPIHFPPMTHEQTIEFIKQGVQGLRERCAQQQAAHVPIPGCPVLTHRY
jgi:glyoxylase-like metal-dependent hydrolase (beta-lactamase superfamily II)